MKYLFLIIFSSLSITPVRSSIDPKLHEICKEARDYAGCIKTQRNNKKVPSQKAFSKKIYKPVPILDFSHFERCKIQEYRGSDPLIVSCFTTQEAKEKYLPHKMENHKVLVGFGLYKYKKSKNADPDEYSITANTYDCKNYKTGRTLISYGKLKDDKPFDVKVAKNLNGKFVTQWTGDLGMFNQTVSPRVSGCALKEGYTKIKTIQLDLNNISKDGSKISYPMFAYTKNGPVNGELNLFCDSRTTQINPEIIDFTDVIKYEKMGANVLKPNYRETTGRGAYFFDFFDSVFKKHC